ncbi:hypothetical protein PCNPT3_12835 [Psychromonas sp. CNPT3]|uniref:hypothetical protein n=1 Tax=Psychromonas sp. CNPT3 TaxID=314282 RepID=UPI0002C0842C|nr:hypothetical protein [Psychromonas sp. CNPT3]AGH82503.1 hypothetical protein PCNPT3_12835 [Psychromonas sp. CNPT3]
MFYHLSKSYHKKEVSLFFTSMFIFMLSFQFNIFGAASDDFFDGYQRASESLVVGRIVETNNHGYFSHGGFLGRYIDIDKIDYQYNVYVKGITPESKFDIYSSSAGVQGFFYSLTDRSLSFFNVNPSKILFINKCITSLSLAFLLSVFIIFSFRNLGCGSAVSSIFLIAISQWLVVFANNLYWMFFLIILPFIISTVFLMSIYNKENRFRYLYWAIFIAILVKSLAGYEYMSTIFISMIIPFIFYAIKDSWTLYELIKRSILISVFAISGLLVAMTIHIAQLTSYLGSISKAVNVITQIVLKRTSGNPDSVPEVFRQSLESTFSEVFTKYWNGIAFNLENVFSVGGTVSFGGLILWLLFLSLFGTFIIQRKFPRQKRLHLAILVSTWVAILAPLSWFFLAKGHSYVHYFINQILWYLPFLLLMFSYSGFLCELTIKIFRSYSKRNKAYCICFIILVGLLIVVRSLYFKQRHVNKLTSNLHSLELINNGDISVSYYGKDIFYSNKKCNENLNAKFFLHLIPLKSKTLTNNVHFNNLDFYWEKKEIVNNSWFDNNIFCITSITFPNYPLKGFRTGQFKNDGQIWFNYVNLTNKRFVNQFQSFNLTDRFVTKGINKSKAAFFIQNNFANRQSITLGDKLIFSFSGERTVEKITYSENYINVSVTGKLLTPKYDAYPNIIKLKITNSE